MDNKQRKDGYIPDLATGKPVDGRKPEEPVRQEYEKILNDDYDYDFKQMSIEVPIQRGSKTKPKNEQDYADIVIYKTTDGTKRDQNADILGIVETKRRERKDGIRQLMSYLSASSASWGTWTNGNEIEYLYKDPTSGEIKQSYIYQIPARGQDFKDMGRIQKKTLIPATNLKAVFRRMLKTLYTNTTISRREKLGNELIRLIFCKIWDERYFPNKPPKFKIGFNDNPDNVKKNIDDLFSAVKEELVEDGVFDKNEEIKLEAKSIAYVVGELERYSLLKTEKDVIGDAFEVFAESKLVGEKGEFFTPREVVKTAMEIVKPQPRQKILDPACGSGGFLIYALGYVWNVMESNKKYRGVSDIKRLKQEIAEKCFFGIDKEMDLVKIAKAYMALVGDGRGGIVQQNTLHGAAEYEGRAKEIFTEKDKFKKFDIIFTNPPFGSKIKVLKEEAKNFELGHTWIFDKEAKNWVKTDKEKETEPQVLFIERCLEMLREGGGLAIVLPETYFHAPRVRYVLNYIRKNNIKAIVDLPHNTFRPHCNAKTVLLVLEKGRPQQDRIIMAVAEEMGHDHRGEKIYRYDRKTRFFTKELWDDTIIIRNELKDPSNPENQNVFTVDVSDIKNDLYVPRYYWDNKIKGLKEEAKRLNLEFVPVKKLIDDKIIEKFRGHGAPPSEYKGKGNVPYVRAADIVNWELYKNPVAMIPEEVYASVKGNGVELKPKDIVFVKEGSYRIGSVALISKFDTGVLLNHHSIVFRVVNEENEYGIDSFYLLYLFSHKLTQRQLYNLTMIDTTLPNIGSRWQEINLPIAKDSNERDKIKLKIREAFEKKWEGQEKIEAIQKEFGNLTK